jgi:hypothetical protein
MPREIEQWLVEDDGSSRLRRGENEQAVVSQSGT